MMNKSKFDLDDRLIGFAVRIIHVVQALPATQMGKHIADQLGRSGTSPAANYGEAESAESVADFIHKMKIALKELRESKVWLKIIEKAKLIEPAAKLTDIIDENDQLISIFVTSITTARKNKRIKSEEK